ncbi:hypothetical protein PV328_009157 [Microctonus aethiopoides]|uniref:Transcription factor IIIC 90kDa subunit N-terminal domain-containing protein n=1 Tax=Microctonus aethiopoides TaxID=144406 RepID=A0AA39C5E8_9HYME|nr:hypothetical protein PV328_009157 [Microctonus aethiopoides]
METDEIYNISVHELVTANFSVDWSLDNQISLITPRGVHIFELQPNILCGNPTAKFKRSFIYASSHLPCQPFIPIIDSLINNFDRENLYLAMLEEALSPKLADKDHIIPRIIAVSWSPIKLVKPSKCLLATVTSAGAIDLALKLGNNWYSICNLSVLWWNVIKNEFDFNMNNIDVHSLNAEIFKYNLRRLQGTAVTWSELYSDDFSIPFSYIVTTYRSCDLVIWKITRVSEFPTEVESTIIYRTRFESQTKITKLLWISVDKKRYLIVIGFFDGQIYCLNDKAEKKCISNIVDNIPISDVKKFSHVNDEINVIIIKNSFHIVITLDCEGNLLKQKHIQLPGFSITGLLVIDENSTIVTTQNARMYYIKFNEECKLIFEHIKYGMKLSKYQFLGLARAPSGATFINVTSPDGLYDHLINREPSILQMFCFKREIWSPWNVLEKNYNCECNTHWDCLETIRIRASREADPENHLPNIPETLESFPIHKLRNIMWLTLITKVLKQKKLAKKIDNVVGEISEAQPLIFVHSASSHIIRLAKKKILTNDMRLCIHFLRLYLEVFLAGEDDDNNEDNFAMVKAKDALNATENLNLIETELCKLCNKVVTELPWNTASCPNGHRLPRCALTLLQISCLKYRSCPVCARIFHPSLDDEYEDVKCLYCNVSTEYDNRVIGVNDELEKKCHNLSLQPIWEMQENKLQESGTCALNEKFNKKRRFSAGDTFTLIVNKDNETITETWQEL